jgi:excisionase family DNA binding protein
VRTLFVIARLADKNLIWIGHGDPKRKLAELNATSPVELELVGAVDEHPRKILTRFAPLRARGAWHRVESDLADWITDHALDPQDLIPTERMLNVKEAAERLGVARVTILRRVAAGDLPYVRIGKQLRFDPTEIAKL